MLKSVAKQRDAQQQQLQALIAEKKMQLERSAFDSRIYHVKTLNTNLIAEKKKENRPIHDSVSKWTEIVRVLGEMCRKINYDMCDQLLGEYTFKDTRGYGIVNRATGREGKRKRVWYVVYGAK